MMPFSFPQRHPSTARVAWQEVRPRQPEQLPLLSAAYLSPVRPIPLSYVSCVLSLPEQQNP